MKLRDWKELAYGLKHYSLTDKVNGHDVWESMLQTEFDKLVKHLSSIQTSERIAVREIIRKKITEKGTLTLLDLGCGPGTEAVGYREAGFLIDYIGVDRSQRMLNVARERNPLELFTIGEVNNLDNLQNGIADIVLLRHVLEHLPNYEDAIKEARRLTKQTIIIDFFRCPTPLPFDIKLVTPEKYHENWYSASKFESYLAKSNFSKVSKKDITGDVGQTARIYVLEK